jgi:hypothetical protein
MTFAYAFYYIDEVSDDCYGFTYECDDYDTARCVWAVPGTLSLD